MDFERAFDSIKRSAIWNALHNKGVPSKVINIIKTLYQNAESSVLHEGKLGQPIYPSTGVRQGCPLSPQLFSITLDDIMAKVDAETRGITWSLTTKLGSLEYADDIALLAHTANDLQQKMDKLRLYAGNAGLQINIRKTKILRCNTTNSTRIVIGNTPLEDVEVFEYLGSKISTSGGTTEDIASRLSKARSAFGRLWPVWRATALPRRTKLNIFNACVKSILMYGSETWMITKKNTTTIQTFVNKCLRIICGIFWPEVITNINLWTQTGQEPMLKQIRRRRWKWIGHTLRKPNTTIAKQALEWNPQGRRKPGRPKTSWRRTILKEAEQAGKNWIEIKQIAQNRVRYRAYVEALCSLAE